MRCRGRARPPGPGVAVRRWPGPGRPSAAAGGAGCPGRVAGYRGPGRRRHVRVAMSAGGGLLGQRRRRGGRLPPLSRRCQRAAGVPPRLGTPAARAASGHVAALGGNAVPPRPRRSAPARRGPLGPGAPAGFALRRRGDAAARAPALCRRPAWACGLGGRAWAAARRLRSWPPLAAEARSCVDILPGESPLAWLACFVLRFTGGTPCSTCPAHACAVRRARRPGRRYHPPAPSARS